MLFLNTGLRMDVVVLRFQVHIRKLSVSLTVLLFVLIALSTNGQVIRAGVKAGVQMNWVSHDNAGFTDTVSVKATPGFNVGAVVSFKVKDRYFLHTEYLFSQRGKTVQGRLDPTLKDHVTYNYIEIPALFTMHFKGSVGGGRDFKWYIGAGPDVSYLLSAHGTVEGSDLADYNIVLDYKVDFHKRENRDYPEVIHYDKANRFLFGLNIGTGLLLEPGGNHKVMLDFRYTVDQSRIGKGRADFLIPTDYRDDLRARFKGVKFSIIYLLESNSSKQIRNKGKSTIKR